MRFPTLVLLAFAVLAFCPPALPQAPEKLRQLDIERITRPRKIDFDQILNRVRNLRVAVPYSRTLFFVDKGIERGVSAEIVREFERFLNRKYKTGNHPIIISMIPLTREELLSFVAEGRADIAVGNITVTPERQQLVAFSRPEYENATEILVSGPGDPAFDAGEGLAGREVAVKKSSSFHASLLERNEELKAAGKPLIRIRPMPEDLETEDLLDMVNAGILPATAIDEHIGRIWAPVLTKLRLHTQQPLHRGGQIAWAMRKDSVKLLEVVNEFIGSQAGGLAPTQRYQQFARRAKTLVNNTASTEYRRFEQTLDIFRKFGAKYGFDPLMLAAQGFQESGLNQEARSHVGAIGLMQLMPATGAEMRVGDVTLAEPNVHAGAKYMDLLMTRFFPDANFDNQNRALFAFAAYNAGPGRISQLRKEAAKRGLNPDKWFDNVEVVVAQRVGIEPVQYVRNIFKYYVAYRLDLDGDRRRREALQQLN